MLIVDLRHFGPSLAPLLQVGYRGVVEVDSGGRAHTLSLDDFKSTCSENTWNSMMHFVIALKKSKTKIAFFSSTPQGGGVALMRHALVRLAKLLDVELTWYVRTAPQSPVVQANSLFPGMCLNRSQGSSASPKRCITFCKA
jgi:hypothetical protein